MAALGALALGWLGWEVARLRAFQREGATLVERSGRFPRTLTVGQGSPRIAVALGDSTAAGVGCASVEETLPHLVLSGLHAHFAVSNLAVSGARLSDVVREQLPRFPNRPTHMVIVSVSANDAVQGTDPESFARDLTTLLDDLRRRRVTRAILTTTPNFETTPALPWAANRLFARRARRLSEIVEQVAARYPFVRVADLNRRGTLPAEAFATDGFHPSSEGYRSWAAVFVESVSER